jgi:4-hydroxy-3-methylbut-2-enyl diphosphate reductase
MKVIEAEAMGMCFGVRDALATMRRTETPADVTVFGQLVHNPLVTRELASRGFASLDEAARSAASVQTGAILITAHGVSNTERARFAEQGRRIIDTTCPLVRKAHAAALALSKGGYFVIVIGKKGHVEVSGLTGDLPPGRYEIVETQMGVRHYDQPRLGVIAQTTTVEREARGIVARIKESNPDAEVRFLNTICQPTRDRQAALERLLDQVDVLVVAGGHHSNNTRQLVARAREKGVRAIHVEEAGELEESMFLPEEVVGLTAGTSTLPETICQVRDRLRQLHLSRRYVFSDRGGV